MKVVAGVAAGALVLGLGLGWVALSRDGGSPDPPPPPEPGAAAPAPEPEPAGGSEVDVPTDPDVDAEIEAEIEDYTDPQADAEVDAYTVPETVELPDDAEIDADIAADRAELGSATLTIDRLWEWGTGGVEGSPMWVMGDKMTIWTNHNLVHGSVTDSVATFEWSDGLSTYYATAPVTYDVSGTFHEVFCEFDLIITETWKTSEASWDNTVLGQLPYPDVPDVVSTFKVKFRPDKVDHFEITTGTARSSFHLSDVVLADEQGCSFTN